MYLESLDLQNFRSFKKKNFNFSPQTTLLVGPNASGKTNVLEAIYLLATGKSFRASKEMEMICYGKEMARVQAVVKSRGSLRSTASNPRESLEIALTTGEVQGKRTRRKPSVSRPAASTAQRSRRRSIARPPQPTRSVRFSIGSKVSAGGRPPPRTMVSLIRPTLPLKLTEERHP